MTQIGTCCFSGHREINPAILPALREQLSMLIKALIADGYHIFECGGALGFDTLAAQSVLSLKREYPDIKLILVLPCTTQTKYWSEENKRIYNNILLQADDVEYIEKNYSRGCMFARNRKLVDTSSLCVCYLSKNKGGTAYTVNYAKHMRKEIINLFT